MQEQEALEAAVGLAVLLIIPAWRIVRRTGWHPALSLLLFFPGIGLPVLALILAFGRWPALHRVGTPER